MTACCEKLLQSISRQNVGKPDFVHTRTHLKPADKNFVTTLKEPNGKNSRLALCLIKL